MLSRDWFGSKLGSTNTPRKARTLPDPLTVVAGISAMKTTFDALRSAIGLVKETNKRIDSTTLNFRFLDIRRERGNYDAVEERDRKATERR